MQSLGNDFVIIDQLKNPIKLNKNDFKKISNRNYGIGCDQVLVLEKSEKKEIAFKYKIYNKDGTESGQCGNGAKCIGKYYFDKYGYSNVNFVKHAQSNFVIMTNRTVFDETTEQITNCFDKFGGYDHHQIKKDGLLLSVIRRKN